MKDRCVCLVQDFGEDGEHVARFPAVDGKTMFESVDVAHRLAYPVEKLREVVVMDVATAFELEAKANTVRVSEGKVKQGGDYAVKSTNVVVLANEEGKVFSSGKGAQLEAYRHTEDAVKHLREVTNDKEPGKVQVLGAVLIDTLEYMSLQDKAQEQLTDEARAKLTAFDAIAKMCVAPGTAPDPNNVVQWVSDWKEAKGENLEVSNMLVTTRYLSNGNGITSCVRNLIANDKFALDLRATLNTLGCDDGVNVAEWLTDTVRRSGEATHIMIIAQKYGWSQDCSVSLSSWVSNTAEAAKRDWKLYSAASEAADRMGWNPERESLADWIVKTATEKFSKTIAECVKPSQPVVVRVARDAAVKRITDTIAWLTTEVRRGHNDSASFAQSIATLETVLATYLH